MSDGKLTLIILIVFAIVVSAAVAMGTGALAQQTTDELNKIQQGPTT